VPSPIAYKLKGSMTEEEYIESKKKVYGQYRPKSSK